MPPQAPPYLRPCLQKQDDILSQETKAKAQARYKADPEKKASVRDSYKADPEKKRPLYATATTQILNLSNLLKGSDIKRTSRRTALLKGSDIKIGRRGEPRC